MEKQILEELYGKLRELIPDFETREEGNKNYISYKMQINDKDFETSVVITNGRAVAITGKRTYIYQIKEKSCEQFNNEVQTRYPLFQIYGGNGNISVGRRLLFDSVDELVTNIREFNSVCKAVIPQFEGSCVNFLVKTREEETYDPTQTFTPLEEESSNEKNADYVDSFVKDQQEYCKKTFYELAEGAEPVTKGNDVSFIRNEGDGSLKVTMDKNAPEDLKLDYAYVVDDQELAYIAIANITSTYKELEAFYNEKKRMLHVYSYVTPDKYLPDEPKEGIELLKEAINNSLETAKKSTVSGEQVSANMQALMNDQLECDLLIVDEMSMVDTEIFYLLLRAIPNGCQIILCGDPDQIESVGCGSVFRDLLNSNTFCTVTLNQFMRQDAQSSIVQNCKKILEGDPDLIADEQFFIGRYESDEAAKRALLYYYPKDEDCMKHQILSTTKQGKVGTEVLNRTLEDPADADSLIYHDYVYRAGDKVVFVSNNYKAGYCNGDVGVITEIHNGMTISLGDETVSLGEYDLDEILPADVITVHKSQGGEYEDVYVMLPEKPRVLLTRNILNTAVSRARKKVMLFTVRNSLSICVSNVMSHNRDTWLSIFFQQDN